MDTMFKYVRNILISKISKESNLNVKFKNYTVGSLTLYVS